MDRNQAEERLQELFDQVENNDYSGIEEFIEANSEDCDEDLAEISFRLAVIGGHKKYVSEHIDDVELNDCAEDGSSYLSDAHDSEIKEILFAAGAFRSWENYCDYSIAIETVNWAVLYFSKKFQRKVYKKYLSLSGLTEDDIIAFLHDESDEEWELPESLEDYDLSDVCDMLKIEIDDDDIILGDYDFDEDAGDLKEFIEALGWDFDFEGTDSRFGPHGVYCIE